MKPIIETEALSKIYGTGNVAVKAVQEINLQIYQGEFVAIVGASGSGKSTLLHLLGGLDEPTSGVVKIDGQSLFAFNEKERAIFRRRKFGFIFQSYYLIPVLNVEENMMMPILLDRGKPDIRYLDELIAVLGLDERRNHLPSELSGGQQQRAAIGRALAYKPSVILADEPTGNLDSKNSREVVDLLKLSVKSFNQTLVMITHDMTIAGEADRVIVMKDGEITNVEVNRR
ncbi:ABC transporter ATP-binding protein [Bacillus chungangensis]|uniref:ABC transport system ATP-binding protein n=1 Tax=Bacillus chungangensis TaxID=587633 RepID=A0ABT9WTC6_9BACI|nr:ABC transporter ATP-binding protein [Bacillus chungangensis]MDQ0176480.1 putative ABC transport system ATP-binding protein [Bacillus chungangensis]